jgi:hypothetical protein
VLKRTSPAAGAFAVTLLLSALSWQQVVLIEVAGLNLDEGCPAGAPKQVLLSFDDRAHLADWVEVAPDLEAHGVRATFMLDRVTSMRAEDWANVSVLVAHGHALGLHGEHHVGATASGLSPEAWVAQEVLPSLDAMAEHDLVVDVVAMPRGDSTSAHEAALLDVVPRVRLTAGPPRDDVTPWASGCGDGPVHAAVSLDERRGGVDRWLTDVLDLRGEAGFGVVHAYGHGTGGEGVDVDALLALVDGSSAAGWGWVGYDALDAEA